MTFFFKKGDNYPADCNVKKDNLSCAGIHRTDEHGEIVHGNCIEIYASSEIIADAIRQHVLDALRTEEQLTGAYLERTNI